MYRKKKMSKVDAAAPPPASTSTDAKEQPPATGNPLKKVTDEELEDLVERVQKAEKKVNNKDNPAAAVPPSPEQLAAAEQAVKDAETAFNTAPEADKAAAQIALDEAKAKLAELEAKKGGRRRSRRKHYKKSGKKSRRQSKKGGKKHRKSTSKKGGKSKKRSQRKH